MPKGDISENVFLMFILNKLTEVLTTVRLGSSGLIVGYDAGPSLFAPEAYHHRGTETQRKPME